MSNQKTLKSICINDLEPTITLTPVVELHGEKCRIHHIKSDSMAINGRDTFVPLRHMSKHKQKIFELEEENAKLRELVRVMHGELVSCEDNGYVCGGHKFDDRVRELEIEV